MNFDKWDKFLKPARVIIIFKGLKRMWKLFCISECRYAVNKIINNLKYRCITITLAYFRM